MTDSGCDNQQYPEGCTPEDVEKLREFNHGLANENCKLRFLLSEAYNLLKQYEMDVDDEPPYQHRELMGIIRRVLITGLSKVP